MRTVKPKLAIFLAIAIFFLQACYCLGSPIPYIVCQRSDGSTYSVTDDLWGRDNCGENGDTQIAETFNYPTDTPPTFPTSVPGQNNIVAPTGIRCNSLTLTSPAGLANGMNTFYWTAVPNAVSYRITIYDHNGTYLATFDSQGSATSLSADVSWGAIGGQYELRIEITAFGGGSSCSRSFTLQREAPSNGNTGGGGGGNGGGGQPAATPTLTCAQDPRPECIR